MDVLFNVAGKERGTVKGINLIVNQPSDTKFDLLLTDINADFKLAPDVIVMRKTKSIAGGIYVTSEPYDILEPKSLTHDDLDMIMKFFTYSAVRMFAMALGIDAPPIGPQ